MTAHAAADTTVDVPPAAAMTIHVDGAHGLAPVLSMVRRTARGTTVMFGARSLVDLVVHRPEEIRELPLAAVLDASGRLWYVAGDERVRRATLRTLCHQGFDARVLET